MGDPRVSDFLSLLEVAKTNSLSKAAKNLQTSPVNLLNRINKLEQYFQTKIFTRTNQGVFLTRDGERIVETARAVVGLLTVPQLTHSEDVQRRTILIGASEIAGEYILPCIISNYKLTNPSVGFKLEILKPDMMFERLSSGTLDMVSYLKAQGRKGPDELEVAKDKLVIITPPKHELIGREGFSIMDALECPIILYEPDHEMAELVSQFLKSRGVKERELDVKMLLPDPASVIAAVSEGLGISICSEIIAKKSERAGMVSIVSPTDAATERYSIYLRRGNAGDSTLNNFWDYLEKLSIRFKGNLPCMLKMLYL